MAGAMSRRGNCYDNAPMECSCSLFKQRAATSKILIRVEAIEATTEYNEIYYDLERTQERL